MTDKNREYLEARIQTASSAQLHLMLLDGAMRFGREAEKGVLRGDDLAYQATLLRTMDIVEELLAGVRHSTDDLNEKLAQLYTFVYARLTSVYVNGDKKMMVEALQILEFQRDTWRQAVEKLATEAKIEMAAEKAPSAPKVPAPKPHLGAAPAHHSATGQSASGLPASGLSIEA
ncbi:flagellar export chaperone FliS [Botrimarina colliarenosi]|nr:flagellar export chaperone FliS [Botrimarina colliarenosi]